ncbi:ATP-binding protein [Streptomyces sp. NPDC054786]
MPTLAAPPHAAPRSSAHFNRLPFAAVTPRPTQRRALIAVPAQEEWVGSARRFASTTVTQWRLSSDEHDNAMLVAGELAANAARHGSSDMTLQLILDPGLLRIAVDDHGGACPHREPSVDHDPDEHGRGMHIVSLLATTVETRRHDNGRCVEACLTVERVRSDESSSS